MGQESGSKMGSAEEIGQLRIAFGFGPKETVESESERRRNRRKRKREYATFSYSRYTLLGLINKYLLIN